MSDLQTRLTEVMEAMQWDRADLVRVSRQSSSVVSQWLGKGSKTIKTIGKLEAAIYIERASGYSALWVAKNMGPKKVAPDLVARAHVVAEPSALYLTADHVLERMGAMLSIADPQYLPAIASNLSGWALAGGASHWVVGLKALLEASPTKQQSAA